MSQKKLRRLNSHFINDLENGILSPLLDAVKSDTSLCLELRGDYVNVYYRGGRLMKIMQLNNGYSICFDENYSKGGKVDDLPVSKISAQEDVKNWLKKSPVLKHEMDCYFGKNRRDEREFQQLMVRDNNFGSIANSTDYYICDIEYAVSDQAVRFDMIAIHWPSDGAVRRKQHDRRLVLIEMKHGDQSLKNMSKHITDIDNYLSIRGNLPHLKEDMKEVFNQKRKLGLMTCQNDLVGFNDKPPMLLLVYANHDPESSVLRHSLEEIPNTSHVDVRIATASFLGYALYDQGIHPIEEAKKRFGDYLGILPSEN